jgi:hypothetical protein
LSKRDEDAAFHLTRQVLLTLGMTVTVFTWFSYLNAREIFALLVNRQAILLIVAQPWYVYSLCVGFRRAHGDARGGLAGVFGLVRIKS